MTAATVEEVPHVGDVYLETVTARQLYRVLAALPTEDRRRHAARAIEHRRSDLALYRTLLIERYGAAPQLSLIEDTDQLLAELNLLAAA